MVMTISVWSEKRLIFASPKVRLVQIGGTFLQKSIHSYFDKQMERKEAGRNLYFMDMIWVPLVGDLRNGSGIKITLDLITKLPRSRSGHDAIWVIVDRLTKSAHFLAIREDFSTEKLARLYIDVIVACHGVPVFDYFRSRWAIYFTLLENGRLKTTFFVKEPVEIMDREIKKLKRRKITLVKVRWNSKCGPEFTWEHEDQMRIKYP
ncbi:putative reverse transcriptase domain-containing protein [Tanacetum coccineum]